MTDTFKDIQKRRPNWRKQEWMQFAALQTDSLAALQEQLDRFEVLADKKLDEAGKRLKWPDGFIEEILAILDRIDVEEDHTLAIQRHAIAEKYGMTVVLGEPISGAHH